jgi:hypothetical protein
MVSAEVAGVIPLFSRLALLIIFAPDDSVADG